MRAHSPAGTRPPWRSRPSWFFSVQMIASTRCRSQLGKYRERFVFAGRADQRQAQLRAGEVGFGVLAGQALAGDDRGAGYRAASQPYPLAIETMSRRECQDPGDQEPAQVWRTT
jgi:hypothetical protein